MCALELVAWLAGEAHSDSPECTSPVIAAFVRAFNDVIESDAARSYYLRSSVPRLINTRDTNQVEAQRVTTVVDTMVRGLLPMQLRQRSRVREAEELTGLAPITDHTGMVLAGLTVRQECYHRETAWAIKIATRGYVPSLWVPVAAKLIGEIGTPEACEVGVRLIGRLVKIGRTVAPAARDQRTVPPSA